MKAAVTRVRRSVLFGVVLLLVLALQEARPMGRAAAESTGITVSGTLLLRDGAPFLPRGFNLIGLLTPAWCQRATGIAARDHFGAAEFAAVPDPGDEVFLPGGVRVDLDRGVPLAGQ